MLLPCTHGSLCRKLRAEISLLFLADVCKISYCVGNHRIAKMQTKISSEDISDLQCWEESPCELRTSKFYMLLTLRSAPLDIENPYTGDAMVLHSS